jgi:hypothetical protein
LYCQNGVKTRRCWATRPLRFSIVTLKQTTTFTKMALYLIFFPADRQYAVCKKEQLNFLTDLQENGARVNAYLPEFKKSYSGKLIGKGTEAQLDRIQSKHQAKLKLTLSAWDSDSNEDGGAEQPKAKTKPKNTSLVQKAASNIKMRIEKAVSCLNSFSRHSIKMCNFRSDTNK